MKQCKILILTNALGGLFSFRIELLRRLLAEGYLVTVSAPAMEPFASRLCEMGVDFVDIPINRHGINPVADLRLTARYVSLIRNKKPDFVLSYTIKPNIYGGIAARLCRVPRIANITGLGSAVENPGILRTITTTLYKIAFKNILTIFFQNTANKEFFESLKLAGGNHRLIPGSGVNLNHHKLQPYPDEEDGVLRFVFVSRVMKQKGIEEVFKAAEHLRGRGVKAEFHIVGDCEENYAELLAEFESKGLITYHGRQNDVRPFVASAHCLIHPSFYPEGMSNVVLEACAAGRPVITTDRPGCREPVVDGVTGFLFPPQNTSAMLARLDEFVAMNHKEREALGLRARTKMEREFDRNIVINAYISELQSYNQNKNRE
ncbi:MAG: glycosyltransferase family 4 protein [Prevotella sp.]|nr:glycosyltransferase family 4 protein [Bacteroides sp.]MCM1366398.1 glycosyltransferase family 4 protein [Prevotella sp.]MCM1436673.1 glycosyltransferase family 4 protein [Prevotella sp.]